MNNLFLAMASVSLSAIWREAELEARLQGNQHAAPTRRPWDSETSRYADQKPNPNLYEYDINWRRVK